MDSLLTSVCSAGESDSKIEELRKRLESQELRILQLESRLASQDAEPFDDGTMSPSSSTDSPYAGESLHERVERIEQSLPQAAELETGFLESLSTLARRHVDGRVHVDAWSFPGDSSGINVIENGDPASDPQDRLLFRRIRFGVHGTVPPDNMSYRVEIEHSGQDGSQFRDAWLGWDDLALFQTIRMGNQKRPYGLDHLNSSNFNVFLERPFVVEGFNQDSRRFGVASYGISDDQAYNWRFGLFGMEQIQETGATIGDELQFEFAWRLANTWWYEEIDCGRNYGHWALSGTFAFPDGDAPNNGVMDNQAIFQTRPEGRSSNTWLDTGRIDGAESYQILGTEAVLNVGPAQLAGEFMNLWLQRRNERSDLFLYGGYVYLSYFLTGEHIPWNRELGILGRVEPFEDFFYFDRSCCGNDRGWGAWQAAVRLSRANFNDDDIFGGVGSSLTLALNWYWNAHARMQFNYIIGEIDDRRAPLNTGGTAIVSGDYQIAGVRFMIDF